MWGLLVPLTTLIWKYRMVHYSLVLHIRCKPAAIVALFYVVIPFSLASCYFVFPPVTKKRTSTHSPNAALSLFINFHCSIFMKSDNWYYKNTFWAKCTHMLVTLPIWAVVKIWMAKFNCDFIHLKMLNLLWLKGVLVSYLASFYFPSIHFEHGMAPQTQLWPFMTL
jgi:hypothetical protein